MVVVKRMTPINNSGSKKATPIRIDLLDELFIGAVYPQNFRPAITVLKVSFNATIELKIQALE